MGRSITKKESPYTGTAPAPVTAKPLTDREKVFLDEYRKRRAEAAPVPTVELVETSPGKFVGHSTHPSGDAIAVAAILAAAGTTSADFAAQTQTDLANAVSPGSGAEMSTTAVNAALAAMAGIAPKDEAEAMLAAQMVGAHAVAMDMLRRTTKSADGQSRERYSNLAIKLMRTYTAQLEALSRYRGKGHQTVRVEHVTVQAGGQAIVGNVNGKGGGGGG